MTAGAVPVPDKLTVCGLLLALSVKVSVPVRAPVAVGVNATLAVQELPAARLLLHVLVSEKLLPTVMLVKVTVAVPELVTFTNCGALLVPTAWLAKVRVLGETLTTGPAGAVLALGPPPPPQPAKRINPTKPVKRRMKLAPVRVLGFFAPPLM
jgi:hypothetical protein